MSTRLDFDVFAKDRASKTFRDIGNDAHRSGGLVRGFGRSLAGAVAGGVIYQGVKEIAGGLVDMGKAAMDDQQAQVVLAQQLKNSAGATKAATAEVEAWIARAGAAYGVTDDDLRPALGRLVAATHDVGDAQEFARLAMDASTGSGKSFTAVTTALAKAAGGQLTALNKVVPGLVDSKDKTATLESVTAKLAATFQGQAAKSAETAAGKYQRLGVQFDETKEAIGARLIPIGLELSDWLLKTAIPAVSDAASELQDNFGPAVNDLSDSVRDVLPEIKDFAESFGKRVVPVLQDTVSAASTLIGFIDGLPGPLKSMGGEAAIAALVLPQLAGGFDKATASAKAFAANAKTATSRTKMLGGAAKTAAGIGGLVLLTEGAKESNDALSDLELVAGGIATGAAFGGLPGAVAGGIGGAFAAVKKASDGASDSFQLAKPKAESYAEALDKVSGAAKGSANEIARLSLQQSGAFEAGKNLGISSRDLVKYVLGNEAAIKRVDAAMASATTTQTSYTDGFGVTHTYLTGQQIDVGKLSTALGVNTDRLAADMKAAQDAAVANGTLSRALKEVKGHGKIVTRIESMGYPETARQVAELTRGMSLTPKEIRTLIKATGADASLAEVQRVIAKMKSQAAASAPAVGQALGDGVVGGFAGTEARLTGAARLAIRSAIAGAKAEADSHSPSKKMMKLGRDMGLGAELGLLSKKNDLSKAATEAIVSVLEKARERIQAKRGGLKDALQDVADDVKSKVDDMDAALSARSDFAAGFQSFASSIFDAPTPEKGPMSAGGLLDFASAQLAQAQKVQEAVNKLTSMGLSQSLIKQLQSKGSSGFDQLIALSSGSQEQINKANSLDKQTTDTLTAAGMTAADATDLGADAVAKTSAATLARLIGEETAKALGTEEGDGETKITGDTLTIIQKKAARHRGRRN